MAHNVNYVVKNDKLIITIDVSEVARDEATESASGKMKLIGTTSGFVKIGTPKGEISVSLTAGFKNTDRL